MRELKPPRPASRKAEKQLAERLRREQRELEQALRDRAVRESMPRDDSVPPPRID